MHGGFDLLLKLRARNLEQMQDILVNRVRKCSRVVELKFMSMLKATKEKQTVYPTFLEDGERP
jgi:Lrp/AsnC family transcriptional regulator, regulator for asnA, asnC and gidA